ncbi:unnamed protein product [Rhizophagus irregularis]|uniref:Uncharacterized protein n=1 Tax=Rhizophagus irregularis TaxID=588596 RepID=A0A916EJ52_9GLOM|nr:unnamed protein product [Rhizophagus irregularis]
MSEILKAIKHTKDAGVLIFQVSKMVKKQAVQNLKFRIVCCNNLGETWNFEARKYYSNRKLSFKPWEFFFREFFWLGH